MRYTIFLFCLLFTPTLFGQITISKANTKNNKPNEPTVVIDPSNPHRIIASANTDNFYFSEDKGVTWKEFTGTSSLGFYGDPVLHYANDKLYFTHLSKTEGKKWGEWFDRIVVQRIDDVNSWQEESYSVGLNEPKMQDKPWLSSNGDSLYVSWTEFDHYDENDPIYRSRIRFSFYDPSSKSFSEAITLSDTTGDCTDGDSTLEGATTAVGRNGEVYCVWSGFNNLYFDRSLDGGITWGKDKIIEQQEKGWNMEMPNIFRANGMPFIQCDRKNDILYTIWADEKRGQADVWLIYSKDKGETWSERIRLNLDEGSGHQYFPNIDIDEETGKVYVAFYDQRHSVQAAFFDIYLAEFEQGKGVKNYRITPSSIALPGSSFFFGDYLDIDVVNGAIAIIYASYDLKDKSSIMVAHSPNINNLTIKPEAKTQLATLMENGKTELILNVQHPYKIRGRIKVGTPIRNKTYFFRESYAGEAVDFEQLIGTYKTTFFSSFKYTIINLETREKTRYKGRKSTLY